MKSPLPLTLIVAATSSHAIGRSSSLPWRLPKEMAYFARVTKGETGTKIDDNLGSASEKGKNVVIMGRKSWEGIPDKFRPLQGRINVVLSRQQEYDISNSVNTHLANSLESSIALLQSLPDLMNRVFLIGGAQLYTLGLTTHSKLFKTDRILLTRIKTEFKNCDAFFTDFIKDEPGKWSRASHDELCEWVGFEVPKGDQKEKDRTRGEMVEYEFQMWIRKE
ncbi:BQ2448_7508 [Microbotryum intermedium]|uniref:Dihydrofolate reductase n=1 Tax=Microbotryum intermedium TaxID=269621 RepID=A0A238FIG5_9BASI|nr:BQ2448_7508 [Microbotryum intermedium]